MEGCSAINKEWNLAICNVKGHRVYQAKWNKSVWEGQISTISLVCWTVKTKQINIHKKSGKGS